MQYIIMVDYAFKLVNLLEYFKIHIKYIRKALKSRKQSGQLSIVYIRVSRHLNLNSVKDILFNLIYLSKAVWRKTMKH